MKSKDVRFKNLPPLPPTPTSIFCFDHMDFELEPGKSISVKLQGSCDSAKTVKETLVAHSIIGRQKGKSRIMQVPIQCQFINPLVKASTNKIHFQIDKDVNDVLTLQKSQISLENIATLPLRIQTTTNKPFGISTIENQAIDFMLNPGEQISLDLFFDPKYRSDFLSRRIEEKLVIDFLDHPSNGLEILIYF